MKFHPPTQEITPAETPACTKRSGEGRHSGVGLHLGEEYQNIDFLSIILGISLASTF